VSLLLFTGAIAQRRASRAPQGILRRAMPMGELHAIENDYGDETYVGRALAGGRAEHGEDLAGL
jgi:hypothetical protein